jgi:hypothetical protein
VESLNRKPVAETIDLISLRSMMGRTLQDQHKMGNGSFPLYKNTLTLSTTTPWDEERFVDCLDDNYTYATNPDNFTWYGLRIILPDDVDSLGSSWFTHVASMVKDDGFDQAYGEETAVEVFSSTFQTTERNPTIRISINDDIIFTKYQFIFDKVSDGEPVNLTKRFGAVSCLLQRDKYGGELWRSVLNGVLTISMSQKQVQEGT